MTGKAGTGKTTFLRNLAQKTHKSHLIVAPTGIAALNAKGVTIHSQFLLPLGSFIPTDMVEGEFSISGAFYTRNTLVRKNPLNKARKQVLRDIDLLIIDEVSMLRADVLDAIDFRLKHARRNYNVPFGGVQLLLIGDLFQLPPIVRDREWTQLGQYYDNAWFFQSIALKQSGFVYIELDKIFRQQDDTFIEILNNLRNNKVAARDIEVLNSHYLAKEDRAEAKGVIHLTTHNRKADAINETELNKLKGKTFTYQAEVNKDFPESMYPVSEEITLKVGAQVMFIKNDTQNQDYFNGKLAEVTSLSSDKIKVRMQGDRVEYTLRMVTWENRKYKLNEISKELEEEVVGNFKQYPIKLAWAITVHKSQGLTFDKAIIDVGQAFAPGQVYVALSRLRSLDGLILYTKISSDAITSDVNVVQFSETKNTQTQLDQQLMDGQRQYAEQLVVSTLHFEPIISQILGVSKGKDSSLEFEDEEMRTALDLMREKLEAQVQNTQVFQSQLIRLLRGNNASKLQERIRKGCWYYNEIFNDILHKLLTHIEEVSQFSRMKTYLNELDELDALIVKKMLDLRTLELKLEAILNGEGIGTNKSVAEELKQFRAKLIKTIENEFSKSEKFTKLKSGRRKKKKDGAPKLKSKKGETYTVTKSLIDQGFTIDQVAEKRGMATSTIEGHVARLIGSGDLDITKFLDKEATKEIARTFANLTDAGVNKVYAMLDGKYSYGKIRMVQAVIANSDG